MILQAMQHHIHDSKVQMWRCAALGHLADEHPKKRHAIGVINGSRVILQAIGIHKQDVKVQEWDATHCIKWPLGIPRTSVRLWMPVTLASS